MNKKCIPVLIGVLFVVGDMSNSFANQARSSRRDQVNARNYTVKARKIKQRAYANAKKNAGLQRRYRMATRMLQRADMAYKKKNYRLAARYARSAYTMYRRISARQGATANKKSLQKEAYNELREASKDRREVLKKGNQIRNDKSKMLMKRRGDGYYARARRYYREKKYDYTIRYAERASYYYNKLDSDIKPTAEEEKEEASEEAAEEAEKKASGDTKTDTIDDKDNSDVAE